MWISWFQNVKGNSDVSYYKRRNCIMTWAVKVLYFLHKYITLYSKITAEHIDMIMCGIQRWKTYKCSRWNRQRPMSYECVWEEAKGPQLRSVAPPCWRSRSPLLEGPCLRFPPSVSPHCAPSNSPQQGSMRERGKMRVGAWMEGDKLTCGVLWGECPTSRPLITIR